MVRSVCVCQVGASPPLHSHSQHSLQTAHHPRPLTPGGCSLLHEEKGISFLCTEVVTVCTLCSTVLSNTKDTVLHTTSHLLTQSIVSINMSRMSSGSAVLFLSGTNLGTYRVSWVWGCSRSLWEPPHDFFLLVFPG